MQEFFLHLKGAAKKRADASAPAGRGNGFLAQLYAWAFAPVKRGVSASPRPPKKKGPMWTSLHTGHLSVGKPEPIVVREAGRWLTVFGKCVRRLPISYLKFVQDEKQLKVRAGRKTRGTSTGSSAGMAALSAASPSLLRSRRTPPRQTTKTVFSRSRCRRRKRPSRSRSRSRSVRAAARRQLRSKWRAHAQPGVPMDPTTV